uniref:Cyclic nucleotide-binding domain-containing protein n=1 Tax=Craspedostauros australis TaxID=1486917 RepID=A0A7R9ZRL1_9STRA
MNAELISHGYSNFASGIFGGLQNYMCYSNSVLYAKSGGEGRISSLGATFASVFLFVVGPAITSYLPRCMAGTLLLHIGIDLVLEGVYDSLGDYDNWEYAAIWVIALVMTFWGMTAALLAGVIAAMSTYAVQSMTFQNPIRQVMKATTLRSSAWNRCATSRRILRDHHTGRSRILIFQLNGHLFFGNVAQMTDTIKETLTEQKKTDEIPLIVIIDFTLVVGMDSSAAHAVHKLKKIIHRLFLVEVCIFVTGTDRGGFPCEYALTQALNMESGIAPPAPELDDGVDWNDIGGHQQHDQPQPQNHHSNSDANANDDVSTSGFGGRVRRGSISVAPDTASMLATRKLMRHCTGCVCESLDEALIFAEDVLVLRVDDNIENGGSVYGPKGSRQPPEDPISFSLSPDDELDLARWALSDLFVNIDKHHASVAVETMLSIFERKEYRKDEMLWEEDDSSSNALFLVTGTLLAYLKGTTTSEIVYRGNFVGELGLVNGTNRLASLRCLSEKAVVYVIDKAAWERLKRDNVKVAAMFNDIVILYMAHRVQHVSNRYFGAMMPI